MKNTNKKGFTLLELLIVTSIQKSLRLFVRGKSASESPKRGFTLLELLIVIGILAILATVAILVINPAELLRRSRDSARISDLSTLKSALGLYLTDASSPSLGNYCVSATIYAVSSVPHASAINNPTLDSATTRCNVIANTNVRYASTSALYTNTNGQGWVPVNFGGMSTGSPLGSLPIDPTNSCASTAAANQLFYTYSCNNSNLTFLLTGRLESTYYLILSDTANWGISAKDGGTATSVYEVGTGMAILLGNGTAAGATTSYGVL